jgi:hypothetical protein
MNATTVAVDVAQKVFELAIADAQWRVVGSARLSRRHFERWFDNRQVELVIMEACGSRTTGLERSRHAASRSACCRRSMCGGMSSVTRLSRRRQIPHQVGFRSHCVLTTCFSRAWLCTRRLQAFVRAPKHPRL